VSNTILSGRLKGIVKIVGYNIRKIGGLLNANRRIYG
jgi:hypothetical protein